MLPLIDTMYYKIDKIWNQRIRQICLYCITCHDIIDILPVLPYSADTCVLFDCGESSAAQIFRHYGPQADAILQKIKAIYVSHMHADHHLVCVIAEAPACMQSCKSCIFSTVSKATIGLRSSVHLSISI